MTVLVMGLVRGTGVCGPGVVLVEIFPRAFARALIHILGNFAPLH